MAAGLHSLSVTPMSGKPSFDYAVVTPAETTPLDGKGVVLDDTDALIKYNGAWPFRGGALGGISYNETRLGTNRTGDSFTLQFTGVLFCDLHFFPS